MDGIVKKRTIKMCEMSRVEKNTKKVKMGEVKQDTRTVGASILKEKEKVSTDEKLIMTLDDEELLHYADKVIETLSQPSDSETNGFNELVDQMIEEEKHLSEKKICPDSDNNATNTLNPNTNQTVGGHNEKNTKCFKKTVLKEVIANNYSDTSSDDERDEIYNPEYDEDSSESEDNCELPKKVKQQKVDVKEKVITKKEKSTLKNRRNENSFCATVIQQESQLDGERNIDKENGDNNIIVSSEDAIKIKPDEEISDLIGENGNRKEKRPNKRKTAKKLRVEGKAYFNNQKLVPARTLQIQFVSKRMFR